jgi:hypothetical protein
MKTTVAAKLNNSRTTCVILITLLSLTYSFFSFGQDVDAGKTSFQQKCVACHTIGKPSLVGPDLKDVSQRRDSQWLVNWITAPDKMIADKDPTKDSKFKTHHSTRNPT